MDKSLLSRIKRLEDKKPSDLIVYAITDKGEVTEGRVKDLITEDGELKEGYSGVGLINVGLVKSGSSLKDLDRLLDYLKIEADKDML